MSITIRASTEDDMPEIQAIYALEVLEGTASFETEPPSLSEMLERRNALIEADMPYLVALEGDRVAGYAYVSNYRSRAAYRHTLENSVYVASWARQRGVGLSLLNELIAKSKAGGFREMVAIIGGSTHTASIKLHEQAGFRHVGVLKGVGHKFGEWVDAVLMQRSLDPK